MKARLADVIVAVLLSAFTPHVLLAKGGGGHGGGGHAAGGHASGSHSSGSRSQGSSAGAHPTARSGVSAVTPTPSTSGGHTRNGQPIVGTAVPRASVPATTSIGSTVMFVPTGFFPYYGAFVGGGLLLYNSPFLWNSYDPFLWGSYDPFYSSYYDPLFRSQSPWYGASVFPTGTAFESGFTTSTVDPIVIDGPSGALRLKVQPKNADVYVDGYYAGIVDEFSGTFQHLSLRPGPHHIEVRAAGYESLSFDIDTQVHHTTVYRGELLRSTR
jgi:hypothetical protein